MSSHAHIHDPKARHQHYIQNVSAAGQGLTGKASAKAQLDQINANLKTTLTDPGLTADEKVASLLADAEQNDAGGTELVVEAMAKTFGYTGA